jgi:CheY-like chemotaxis protein
VLVVEDDDRLRKLTVTRLQNMGYRVREASNGVHALEALRNDADVDLVFTDLVMPGGMSGIDLVREVGAHYPSCRVLLTSGYAEELVSSSGIEENFVRLLRKPYRQSDLAAAIRAALE